MAIWLSRKFFQKDNPKFVTSTQINLILVATKQEAAIIECEEAQETIESNQPASAVESLMQFGTKRPFTMATEAQ